MKKFFNNPKLTLYIKWSQFAALVLVLGASLSWNPEYFQVARHELVKLNHVVLAQSSADTIKGEFEKSEGKFSYQAWKEDDGKYRGSFTVLESNCNCDITGTLNSIPKSLIDNADKAVMAAYVYQQYQAQDTAKKSEIEDEIITHEGTQQYTLDMFENVFSNCSYDRKDKANAAERLECYSQELPDLVEICENLAVSDAQEKNNARKSEYEQAARQAQKEYEARLKAQKAKREQIRKTGKTFTEATVRKTQVRKPKTVEPRFSVCKSFSTRYYNQYMKNPMRLGLASDRNSDEFVVAADAADSIVEMDSRYSNPLIAMLSQAAFQGLVNQSYMACGMPSMGLGGFSSGFSAIGPSMAMPQNDLNISTCMGSYVQLNGNQQVASWYPSLDWHGRNLLYQGLINPINSFISTVGRPQGQVPSPTQLLTQFGGGDFNQLRLELGINPSVITNTQPSTNVNMNDVNAIRQQRQNLRATNPAM